MGTPIFSSSDEKTEECYFLFRAQMRDLCFDIHLSWFHCLAQVSEAFLTCDFVITISPCSSTCVLTYASVGKSFDFSLSLPVGEKGVPILSLCLLSFALVLARGTVCYCAFKPGFDMAVEFERISYLFKSSCLC